MSLSAPAGSPLRSVVDQHAEEAAFLWLLRDEAVRAPHYTLDDLSQLDLRIEAHIDGLAIAGDVGRSSCIEALAAEEPGEIFAAAVLSLRNEDPHGFAKALDASRSSSGLRALSASLGWVSGPYVDDLIDRMLRTPAPAYRYLGVVGLAVNRKSSDELARLAEDPVPSIRARALRAIGELKRRDLLGYARPALNDPNPDVRFWASWSTVLVGDPSALGALCAFIVPDAPQRLHERALNLALRVMDVAAARTFIKGLIGRGMVRSAITACGISGDPIYVEWLIRQMEVPDQARVAGEAFSMITGADLALLDLDGDPPPDFEAGPSENPDDEDVAMDPDENLAWPDIRAIQDWWKQRETVFEKGSRYLGGRAITDASCRTILADGYQRQRIAAAHELALLNAAEPLFEWRAPGFRQRLLVRRA